MLSQPWDLGLEEGEQLDPDPTACVLHAGSEGALRGAGNEGTLEIGL